MEHAFIISMYKGSTSLLSAIVVVVMTIDKVWKNTRKMDLLKFYSLYVYSYDASSDGG